MMRIDKRSQFKVDQWRRECRDVAYQLHLKRRRLKRRIEELEDMKFHYEQENGE